jgi:hypothetical protein
MYRIHKQHARVLTNRKPTEPVPAVEGLLTEERTVNGIVKDVVVAGRPTWKKWDLARVQEEIDTYGLSAFRRECLHEVEQSKEGLILHNYDDNVHVITQSEFESVYGRNAWKSWAKWNFNDWARTKTKYHANVAGYITVSSQNTPLPGFTFMIHPMSFPANSAPEDVAARMLSVLSPYADEQRGITWEDLMKDTLIRANANVYTRSFADKLEYERGHLAKVIPQYSKVLLKEWSVKGGVMSHSEDTVRAVFNNVFGFNFQPANPGKNDAIEDINDAMRVDYDEPHPFRPDSKGYTRWFVVVPDEKIAYPDAMKPDDLHDCDLLRYQFCNWRYRDPVLTATGENIDDTLKLNDDFGQATQFIYFKKLLQNVRLTPDERFDEELRAKGLTPEVIERVESEQDKLALIQQRMIEQRAFALKKKKSGMPQRVSAPSFRR